MKRKVLKIFKILGIIIGVLIMAFLVLFLMFNERLPQGEKGAAADALAEKVFMAIDKSAWDSTGVVQWTFRDSHHFLWDKKRNWVRVQWADNEVFVILDELKGVAFKGGKKLEGNKADKLVKKAWAFFANDSFWLNAPSKVFDKGTERRLVKMEDGEEALLITYTSGGTTPGDSYLWILDENGLPKSWKMWVKIIPIGGVQTTWQDWKTLETGAKVAQNHQINEKINIPITNLKAATDLKTFGLENDPFVVLE
jgi:hypothetical protein